MVLFGGAAWIDTLVMHTNESVAVETVAPDTSAERSSSCQSTVLICNTQRSTNALQPFQSVIIVSVAGNMIFGSGPLVTRGI